MNEPEPTKVHKPESPTGQDETTDQADPSTLGYDAAVSAPTPTFGDYELITEIARGGMGVVYKARHKSLNRIVALKMIKSGEFANQEQVDRFYKEAEAAANLDHPGIVPVHEVGEVDGQHYFTMGFVDGESLFGRLRNGPLAPKKAAQYAKSIAEAVAFAHSKGVIHRDLKPGNVLITKEGTLRITDFGLAKRIEEDSELTSTGQVLGTPSYMPPEQAEGKLSEIGPAADVYAVGGTLYCMLTGRPPFQAANLIETLHQVLETEPVSLSSLNRSVPQDLETLCLKCLEKKSSNRYESADELVAELCRFLNGEPIQARPIGRVEQGLRWCKRKPAMATALGLMFILSVVGPWAAIAQSLASTRTAMGRVDALLNASPAAIPVFLRDIDRDISIVESRLRELSTTKLSPSQRLRLGLALLPSDPGQLTYLKDRLNDCSYKELAVVLERLKQNNGVGAASGLWMTFHNQTAPSNDRFRAGIALASLDPESDQWIDNDYEFLATSMLQEITVYQPAIRQALKPIADKLLERLKLAFHSEQSNETLLESAAAAIVEFCHDDSALLTDLSISATAGQHSILFAQVARQAETDEAIVETFVGATKQQPEVDYNEAQRVALGKRRAGAAINLLRMNELKAAMEVLRINDDPESLTQFVNGCKARGVRASQLLDLLNLSSALTERYGVLLALGDYAPSTLPHDDRNFWIDHIKDLYRNDPSSVIHGASRWLLCNWGYEDDAKAIEQVGVPYSPDREWFRMNIMTPPFGLHSSFTFVVFPAGEYRIGSPESERDRESDEHVRTVRITRPFAVLDREITRGEYQAFTGFRGYNNEKPWMIDPASAMGGATWYGAISFCRALTTMAGTSDEEQAYADPNSLDTTEHVRDPQSSVTNPPRNWPIDLNRMGFRLPTFAEFEVARRAGISTTFGFGSDRGMLQYYGWYEANSGGRGHQTRELRPNHRGLFDMHGNMWEWCHDWWGENTAGLSVDPIGPPDGSSRVLPGGSWSDFAPFCRSSYRYYNQPTVTNVNNGFRVVFSIDVSSSHPQ